jgi:hypothetical protein
LQNDFTFPSPKYSPNNKQVSAAGVLLPDCGIKNKTKVDKIKYVMLMI